MAMLADPIEVRDGARADAGALTELLNAVIAKVPEGLRRSSKVSGTLYRIAPIEPGRRLSVLGVRRFYSVLDVQPAGVDLHIVRIRPCAQVDEGVMAMAV